MREIAQAPVRARFDDESRDFYSNTGCCAEIERFEIVETGHGAQILPEFQVDGGADYSIDNGATETSAPRAEIYSEHRRVLRIVQGRLAVGEFPLLCQQVQFPHDADSARAVSTEKEPAHPTGIVAGYVRAVNQVEVRTECSGLDSDSDALCFHGRRVEK